MKFTKRLASLLLAIVMLFSITAGIDLSAYADVSADFEYAIQDDGTIGIYGYSGSASNLIIPSTIDGKKVTEIEWRAFYECTSLKSIIIPSGITYIAYEAFSGCKNLASITLPNSVLSIGNEAFLWCANLKSVTIPNSVKSIEDSAFEDCISLANIEIKNSFAEINQCAFDNTEYYNNKKNWTNGVLYIGNCLIQADEEVLSGAYSIKSGTTAVAEYAIGDCTNLTSVTMPDSLIIIASDAFEDCENLKSVAISKSVQSIGDYAFYGCKSLKSITIPSGVTSIGDSVFGYCDSLQQIDVDVNNKNYSSENGILWL